MCAGLSVERRAIPNELIKKYRLEDRIVKRQEGAEEEIHFQFYRSPMALIPAYYGGQLDIFEWGNRSNKTTKLPKTGWCRTESLEQGKWKYFYPEEIDIPASFGLEKGVWFQITEGMKGILVKDEADKPHIYMLTKPASHYYEVMTRHDREPIFIGNSI